mgnify:CR=1 FL=1|tara:strand:+ start:149 stop:313 length:165 start_codon:yes stop_codon:yes gene_type:complete
MINNDNNEDKIYYLQRLRSEYEQRLLRPKDWTEGERQIIISKLKNIYTKLKEFD